MRRDSRNTRNSKFAAALGLSLLSTYAAADMDHYTNTLLGGRASTMGGAYNAISDDASGAFYNPAGLSFATSSSFSGSANTYSTSKSTYKDTIDDRDWQRDSSNLKPNFFGVVQKKNNHTFALSYAVTDSVVEHQDQIFQGLTGTVDPIDTYVFNLHTEDNTYLVGPSYSYKFNPKLSIGASLFYHMRIFRRAQSQLMQFTDGEDEANYLNNTTKEKGLRPKLGVIYSPADKWSLGLTFAKTSLLTNSNDTQLNQKDKGEATYQFSRIKSTTLRKTPYEFGAGAAYFANAYLLLSADINYYMTDEKNREDTANFSLGAEYFVSEKHAVRGGLYTNRANTKKPPVSGSDPVEHIDLYGMSLGYTYYTQATAITFGTIASQGNGKAQIYSGSTATKSFSKTNLDFIIAADYGF